MPCGPVSGSFCLTFTKESSVSTAARTSAPSSWSLFWTGFHPRDYFCQCTSDLSWHTHGPLFFTVSLGLLVALAERPAFLEHRAFLFFPFWSFWCFQFPTHFRLLRSSWGLPLWGVTLDCHPGGNIGMRGFLDNVYFIVGTILWPAV